MVDSIGNDAWNSMNVEWWRWGWDASSSLRSRWINSNRKHRPMGRGVQRLDDERVQFSWQPHWIREFYRMYNRRYVLCHQVRQVSMILSLDHRDGIPRLACHRRCANPLRHNQTYSWLVPVEWNKMVNNHWMRWINGIFALKSLCLSIESFSMRHFN